MDFETQVISLLRSPERRATFAELNRHLRFAWFDAVDGREQGETLRADPGFIGPGVSYNAGALGAAASHRALWERAAAGTAPLTIVEDDAVFRLDFEAQRERVLQEAPSGWDIVTWGWNFDSILEVGELAPYSRTVMAFTQPQLREQIPGFRTSTTPPRFMRHIRSFGLPAYTVSPAGARRLLAACFPLRPMGVHVPILNSRLQNVGIDVVTAWAYGTLEAYCCFPPLVVTPNEHETSTIQRS